MKSARSAALSRAARAGERHRCCCLQSSCSSKPSPTALTSARLATQMLKSLRRVSHISHLLTQTRSFNSTSVFRSALDMETVHTTERLTRLRELMKHNKVDIYSTVHSRRNCRWLTDARCSRPIGRQPSVRIHSRYRCETRVHLRFHGLCGDCRHHP